MKKQIILALAVVSLLASCSDNFLNRFPDGASISEEQYNNIGASRMEGTLRGLYSMIYTDNSSSHDVFGQRSIDLWGDILCGDIAVTNKTYGWLYSDEQMMTVTARTGYIWSFYYGLIHNINTTVKAINANVDIKDLIDKNGYPSEGKYTYTEEEVTYALYMAQALALRGYAYANLARWYTPIEGCDEYFKGYTIETYPAVPVYTEENMENPQGLSTSAQVYDRALGDLEMAIKFFDEFAIAYETATKSAYVREGKLAMDADLARGLAAYAYLNMAPYYESLNATKAKKYYALAEQYAGEVLDSNHFQMISNANLTTTGFNSVSDNSWMWGQEVTTETAGGLKSWFGQVDIHSYSYAWAGDTKVVDDNLKNEIPGWDARAKWFNDGKGNARFKGCPDGKFFSAANPTSTKDEDIDREWLSDNVLMRIESMLLIKAEAQFMQNKLPEATATLKQLTDQRLDEEYLLIFPDDYTDYQASLTDKNVLREAIYYNWRIEMWGEGYGLQTFRRLGIYFDERVRGGSHDYNPAGRVRPTDVKFNMNIPTSEATYNPNI